MSRITAERRVSYLIVIERGEDAWPLHKDQGTTFDVTQVEIAVRVGLDDSGPSFTPGVILARQGHIILSNQTPGPQMGSAQVYRPGEVKEAELRSMAITRAKDEHRDYIAAEMALLDGGESGNERNAYGSQSR